MKLLIENWNKFLNEEQESKEEMVQVAQKLPQTDIGQEIIDAALQDPEIRAQAEQLALQLKEQGTLEELSEEMDAGPMAAGVFAGPMAYMAAGMPGMSALQASIGPIAASVGIYGATMVGGIAIGLVISVLAHIAKHA
jgi:hypothetical protein